MQQLNFTEVFQNIENDCKYVPSLKNSVYKNKKELIVPMLFTDLTNLDQSRDYYINKYIFEYQSCTSPSMITNFEIVNDYIENNKIYQDFPIQRKFNYLDIYPTTTNLNTPCTNVLKTTVMEMNTISPIICGQFFENIVSLSRKLDISRDITTGPYIEEKPDDILYLIDSLKINGEFKTIYHENLAMCLLTQLVHATDLTDYFCEFIRVRNLLDKPSYIKMLDVYVSELSKTLIGGLKNPKKSVKVYKEPTPNCEYISGETDLITDDAVIDIKCYKKECIKLWKYQLEIYNNLLDRPRKKLMIINLLNNKVYTWNITFENLYKPMEKPTTPKKNLLISKNKSSKRAASPEEILLISED